MTTTHDVRPQMAQPTPELHTSRVQHVIDTLLAHQERALLDPSKCLCGTAVADGAVALRQHAVEQVLIALPDVQGVEVPAAAELADRALDELLEHDTDDIDRVEFWHHHVTRMHTQVYKPLIDALAAEVRTTGLAWETLAAVYAGTVTEHADELRAMTGRINELRAELRQRNRDYGRASATIGELRAHNQRLRDQRFDAMTSRGAMFADLVATRRLVERQHDTIRGLVNQARELGGTVDDTELLGPAGTTSPAATPAVSIQ